MTNDVINAYAAAVVLKKLTSFKPVKAEVLRRRKHMYELKLGNHSNDESPDSYAYAYVVGEGLKSKSVYLLIPTMFGREATYRAAWLLNDQVIELVEPETLQLAQGLFKDI